MKYAVAIFDRERTAEDDVFTDCLRFDGLCRNDAEQLCRLALAQGYAVRIELDRGE